MSDLACPVMSQGADWLVCIGENCAWFDVDNRCCGAIRPPERVELTAKGWAEAERIRTERNGGCKVKLTDYLR